MRKIHFIGGEKGGVGKSFTSRLLAQYHIDRQLPFIGFDTDQSHTTFARFYAEFTNHISTATEKLDTLIDELEEHPNCNMIVDLAAQTADDLFQWIEECDFYSIMQEMHVEVYFWHVLDDSADCKNLLQTTQDLLHDTPVTLVVVKNKGRSNNFGPLENSTPYKNAIASNAKILTLEALRDEVVQKIDFDNLSFWAAAHNPSTLSRVERQRTKVWLDVHFRQLDLLLPSHTTPETNYNEQSYQL